MLELLLPSGKEGEAEVWRRLVRQACAENDLDGTTQYILEVVTAEIYSNIVTHAYEGKGGWVRLRMYLSPQDVTLVFSDRGRRFDFNAAPMDLNRIIQEERERGLGLYMVFSIMDEIRYIRRKGLNEHILIKRLRGVKEDGEV